MHRMVRFLPLVLLVACAQTGHGTAPPQAVAAAPAPSVPAAQAAATPAQPVPASPAAQASSGTVSPPAAQKAAAPAKAKPSSASRAAKAPAAEERAAPEKAAATETAAQQPAAPPPAPALDLAGLENRLRNTNAIGVFTKLSLKNNVDDLLMAFRAFYNGTLRTNLADLRQRYDGLVMKVLTLVQNGDPTLAQAINSSRDAIWGILSDRQKFQQFSLK